MEFKFITSSALRELKDEELKCDFCEKVFPKNSDWNGYYIKASNETEWNAMNERFPEFDNVPVLLCCQNCMDKYNGNELSFMCREFNSLSEEKYNPELYKLSMEIADNFIKLKTEQYYLIYKQKRKELLDLGISKISSDYEARTEMIRKFLKDFHDKWKELNQKEDKMIDLLRNLDMKDFFRTV